MIDARQHLYNRWNGMRSRCSGNKNYKYYENYKNTKVCEEWDSFESFYSWAIDKDFYNRQLDKDLLGDGTLYSPDTCAFILPVTNIFVKELPTEATRCVTQNGSRFNSCIKNSITGRREYLGTYDTLKDARDAHRLRRGFIATLLADYETDERAKDALVRKFYVDPDTISIEVVLRVGEFVEKNNY